MEFSGLFTVNIAEGDIITGKGKGIEALTAPKILLLKRLDT